jgi:hypothetical protein
MFKNTFRSGFRFSCVVYLIYIIYFLPLQAGGQNYLWPTNATKLLSSSFCEFRPRHYHAAIDIKTWNRTGYRIFAIDDGYIMRVRTSAFGYGKAVYLKLKDGNIAVYAHLSKFDPEMDAYILSRQESSQSYYQDIHLTSEKFPVKRGQVIGYTGRSGIGYPHLHFEIRNSRNEPINPMQFYLQEVQDTYPPRLYEAAFIPMDYQSLINQKTDTFYIDLGRTHNYSLPDTLLFNGKIGLALKSYDQANGASNQYSFYTSRMWIDDSLVYSVQYDRFSYGQTARVELDKNFSLWRKGAGIFHNFFKHPLNSLPLYGSTSSGGGIIDCNQLKDGIHQLKVEILDFHQNQATFEMKFLSGHSSHLYNDLKRFLEGELFFRVKSIVQLQNIKVQKLDTSNQWQLVPITNSYAEVFFENNYHYTFSVSGIDSSQNNLLKISATDNYGIPSFPLYLNFDPNSSPHPDIEDRIPNTLVTRGTWLQISADTRSLKHISYLGALYKKIPEIFGFPLDPHGLQIQVPVKAALENQHILEPFFDITYPNIVLIENHQNQRLISTDGLFSSHFPPTALYNDAIVHIEESADTQNQFSVPASYNRIGKIYDLSPFDEPVDSGIWISLNAPDFEILAEGLGLYYWDTKKGWLFIPSSIDSVKMSYAAKVTSLEKFTLIQDTIPPVISPLARTQGQVIRKTNGKVRFHLKDEMSGIFRESQIQVELDGNWHLCEYDPEEDSIIIDVPATDKPSVELKIVVFDNVGNKALNRYMLE